MENTEISIEVELSKNGNNLWGWYLPVDHLITEEVKELGWKRMIARVENADPIHCAIVSFGKGIKGIMLNKDFVKKNTFLLGQKLQLKLTEDKSKYGMATTEEFDAVLDGDPEAEDYFENLSPGKQRNLIHYVGNVKSSDIRIRRALVVMEHLKIHHGTVDFKALNAEMKAANNREKLR